MSFAKYSRQQQNVRGAQGAGGGGAKIFLYYFNIGYKNKFYSKNEGLQEFGAFPIPTSLCSLKACLKKCHVLFEWPLNSHSNNT